MRVRFTRLGFDVPIESGTITTMQTEDRQLFSRIIQSLLSEKAEYAEEPYLLFDDDGKRMNPRHALHLLNSLPSIPLTDRAMLGKLYQKIVERSELNSELYCRIQELASDLNAATENVIGGMWGDYFIPSDWSLDAYLKAINLSPIPEDGCSLLENCIRYFGLCADISDSSPVVLVNAKSFFSRKELNELFENAVFLGVKLLLIESWRGDDVFELEKKTVLDLHLLPDPQYY